MDTVEDVILSPTTSPVVRERLMDVLAGATFTFHGPGKEGFQSTWKRVRPPNKPEGGIPFDMNDFVFESHRSRPLTSPVPQVTYANTPSSPQVHQPNTRRQDSDQSRHRTLPSGPIAPEEDMQNRREVAVYGDLVLNESLGYSLSPDTHSSRYEFLGRRSGKLTYHSRNTMHNRSSL